MTADIINLRQARKAKRRDQKEAAAAEKRLRFGKSRSEKTTIESDADKAIRFIDAHRLQGFDHDDDGA